MIERKVPIDKSKYQIHDEFNSIRDEFEAEMKKMEDDMNRFRETHEKDTRSDTIKTTLSPRLSEKNSIFNNNENEFTSWVSGLNSPMIQDDGEGGKMLKLKFDVTQYKPEEIVVKTIDNRLQVQAKHEEKSENRSCSREYSREFLLPKGVNPEMIRSSLSKDGILTIEAPFNENAEKKSIMHKINEETY